MCVTR
jgi:hypothetical protein